MTSYATNCYEDALEEAHTLLANGIGTKDIQIVEFVPYDYIMQLEFRGDLNETYTS